MSDEERSPRILAVAWGRMEVDGIGAGRTSSSTFSWRGHR
jgi:hypothetical protein